jgi:hypothetical protein
MATTDKDTLATVERAVFSWLYLAKKQKDVDALDRLVNREDARFAWLELSRKPLLKQDYQDEPVGFWEVATFIGRDAAVAHLEPSEKRTQEKIQSAAKKAADMAEKLCRIIKDNATLRNTGTSLMSPDLRAAHSRISRGVISQSGRGKGDRWFPPDIEKELDQLQARDYPEFAGMTTSEAYRRLGWVGHSDDDFLEQLQNFAKLARESSSLGPIVPRPKGNNADAHAFALGVCATMDHFYGSPNLPIVTAFVTVVFDREVNEGTIKQWWQRKRDISE